MKKLYMVLLFALSGFMAGAQSFGTSKFEVTGTYDINMLIYNVWLQQGSTGNVTMRFNQTPEGINEAVQMVKKMLAENGRSMENPDVFNSFEGSDLNRKDAGKMHYSIQVGNSRINEGWIADDGSILQLLLGACNYEVNIINAIK